MHVSNIISFNVAIFIRFGLNLRLGLGMELYLGLGCVTSINTVTVDG